MLNIKFTFGTDFTAFDKKAFLEELKLKEYLFPKNAVVTFDRIYPSGSSHLVYFRTLDTDTVITSILEKDFFNDKSVFRVYS